MQADDVSGYRDYETMMNGVMFSIKSRDKLIPIPDEFRNMVGLEVEKVRIVLYDANLKVLVSEIIGTGTHDNVSWNPDRLSELARTTPNARYATFCHNHPMVTELTEWAHSMGVNHPDVILPYSVSDPDLMSTFNAMMRFAVHGIELRDHLVIGERVAVSIRRFFSEAKRAWPNQAPGFASKLDFNFRQATPAYA